MSFENSQNQSLQASMAQDSELVGDQVEDREFNEQENSERDEENHENEGEGMPMYQGEGEGDESDVMYGAMDDGEFAGEGHYEGDEDQHGEMEDDSGMQMNNQDKTPKDNLSKVSEQKEDYDDQEEFDFLPPERKVRFRVLRFINKLREKYNLLPFYNDPVGNKVAMAYAKYLLKDKENDGEIQKFAKYFGYAGTAYKISNFSVFIDVSNDDGGKKNKYSGFVEEFLDAHSTLVEFEQHKNNLLSNTFNTVSFGCAFDEEKVVVVDIFNTRTCTVDEVKVNHDTGQVVIIGKMLNLKYGPFALRIVNEDAQNKELIKINVQNISYNRQTNIFR